MKFTKLRACIDTLEFGLSKITKDEIQEKEIKRLLCNIIKEIEQLEKEDEDLKKLAWELANKLS